MSRLPPPQQHNFATLRSFNSFSAHQIVCSSDPAAAATAEKCPVHGKKFTFYDKLCECIVCTHCIIFIHKGHNCVPVSEAAMEMRVRVKDAIAKASSLHENVMASEKRMEGVLSELTKSQQETEIKIKRSFKQVCSQLLSWCLLSSFFSCMKH